jgi:hypothetical protein
LGAKLALDRQKRKSAGAMHRRSLFIAKRLDVIGVGVSLGLPEILLGLAFKLFRTTLDVLAGVVGGVTDIAADPSLHFLDGSFDLVLETAIV